VRIRRWPTCPTCRERLRRLRLFVPDVGSLLVWLCADCDVR
jgi:hypothetical protein